MQDLPNFSQRSPAEWRAATAARAVLRLLFASILVLVPAGASAESVPVLHSEGITHGFLVLRTLDGKTLADGEINQFAEGHLVKSHLVFHFKDGSLYEERAQFSQNGHFKLLSDHLVQKGPAFKHPTETLIDVASGHVSCRYVDDDGKEETADEHMNLPDDVANGLLFTIVRHIKPTVSQTTVSQLAMTPKPRIVQLMITPSGDESFSSGINHYKATHYVVKVKIGGIAGLVAPHRQAARGHAHLDQARRGAGLRQVRGADLQRRTGLARGAGRRGEVSVSRPALWRPRRAPQSSIVSRA
jgi:hypothetical protein